MTKLSKEAQIELEGLIKEKAQEIAKEVITASEEARAEKDEAQAKALEALPEMKAQMEKMQDKLITLKQKTGTNTYRFKGFDPNMSKNFKAVVTNEEAEAVAKTYLEMIKGQQGGDVFAAVDKAFDGSNALGVQYGSALMGLAELNSVALQYADVIVAEDATIKLPAKGTRDAVDSQTPGTTRRVGTSTLDQITWTIDKFTGNYIELLTNQIEDAKFDIVNTFIIPLQAEAMGQNYDTEMFNGGEYTSSIVDATASVTASGATAIGNAVTFANLTTMYNALSWDRGITNPMWFGSQGAYKSVMELAGSTNDHPIFLDSLTSTPVKQIFGSQYVVTPVVTNTPADGAIRLAFGDPKHYRIFIRGGQFQTMVNPYIKMKEDLIQFICKSRSDGNISDHATPGSTGAFTTMKRVD